MPLTTFVCPDGQGIALLDCLASCRLGRRCLSLPTLRECARQRPWNGAASVTQLLNGTMLEYLKITVPYSIVPESRAFALLGTAHHARLEDMAFDSDAEFCIDLEGVAGHPDFLEEHDDHTFTLWDYKTWGSFKVAKALGLEYETIDDPTGEVYARSGAWGRAGTVKQVKVWTPNPLSADLGEPMLQMNAYRLGIETQVPVREMRLQVTVRDGGIAMARQRGIDRLVYTLTVPKMDDDEVRSYFADKAAALQQALRDSLWTLPCSTSERWDDERCKAYCEVWASCPHGRDVHDAHGQD